MLKGLPLHKRRAYFITVIAFISEEGTFFAEGRVGGFITLKERGKSGFGYDPVFLYPELGRTFAELPLKLKNRVSHRAKALAIFKEYYTKVAKV